MGKKRISLVVGAFVGLGSLLIFGIILLLGQASSLFQPTTTLYSTFENVSGLKPGSQVRLAGVSAGTVKEIVFAESLNEKKLQVELDVRSYLMPRIREDSVATVATKGLLGDKVIDITVGSMDSEPLKEGDMIKSEDPADMFQMLEKGGELITHGADVAKELKKAIKEFTSEGTVDNVKDTIKSIKNIVAEVETGDGVVHGLVYDKDVNSDLKVILQKARDASIKVDRAVLHVEKILEEVRTGKGTLHGIIYDEDGKKIVENVRRASHTFAELVDEIKSGEGMLHTLIYEKDTGNMIRNLEAATADIKKMAAYIESGHGTIGALIKDPTVFEDLKMILGNIKRNKMLKALIRMSIDAGEDKGLNEPLEPPDEKTTGRSKTQVEPEKEGGNDAL